MNYPHIAGKLFNTPLLMHPQKLDAIIMGLGERLLGSHPRMQTVTAELPSELFTTRATKARRTDEGDEYQQVGALGIVPVIGALAHRGRIEGASARVLGYDDIIRSVAAAGSNPEITEIMLLIDSPGGEATGAFEAPGAIREAANGKRITAMIDGISASAGYLLASSADQIISIPSGYAGSIGVVSRHADLSQAMAEDGVKITHIYAGAHKVDGNPYEPLSDSVKADFQQEINSLYDVFVSTVANLRGLSAEHVRGTQARTYRAEMALDAGLIDRIETTDKIITELSTGRTAQKTNEVFAMSDSNLAGQEKAPAQPLTQADLDTASKAGFQEGIKTEQARVSAVLTYADEQEKGFDLAHKCIEQGLSVEQSKAMLDAVPAAPVAPHESMPGITQCAGHDLGPDAAAQSKPDVAQAAAHAVSAFVGRAN